MQEEDTEVIPDEGKQEAKLESALRSPPGLPFLQEQLIGSPQNTTETVFGLIKQKKVRELELFLADHPLIDLTQLFDT